jgi:protein TonB
MTSRLFLPFSSALLVTLGLFLLMAWMIRAPIGEGTRAPDIDAIEVVEIEKEQPDEDEPPPPPEAAQMPDSPAALKLPELPQMAAPAMNALALDSSVSVPINLGASGFGLGSGAFAGFARGSGSGAGGGGAGSGKGFSGKELIPLSTARPQIPEWAYKRGIEGWVEVVFTVMPNGHVQNVKIIDAQPKGVFEAAAVESISNWIYAEHGRAREVKQRVEFKLEDFKYNWQ